MKIRTVRPEFWQSQKLATRTTRDARLLLVGLLCCADDHGRFRAHPALLRGELFPYEPDAAVAEWLGELVALGIIRLYVVGGQDYGVVVNFAEHQKIDKRWASRLPEPPPEPPPATPRKKQAEAAPERAAPATNNAPDHTEERAHRTEEPASLAEQAASITTEPARNGRKPYQPRLAEEPASLAPSSASLANSTPPDRIGSERNGVPPYPPRQRGGAEGPEEIPDQKSAAEPEAEPSRDVVELHRGLLFSGYRSGLKPHDRVRVLFAKAVELDALGMTADHFAELVVLDRAKATTPGALLAVWLDRAQWRDVLGELGMKAKERGARARGAAANAAAANGAAITDPQSAAAVAAAVVANARPA